MKTSVYLLFLCLCFATVSCKQKSSVDLTSVHEKITSTRALLLFSKTENVIPAMLDYLQEAERNEPADWNEAEEYYNREYPYAADFAKYIYKCYWQGFLKEDEKKEATKLMKQIHLLILSSDVGIEFDGSGEIGFKHPYH